MTFRHFRPALLLLLLSGFGAVPAVRAEGDVTFDTVRQLAKEDRKSVV